MAKPDRRKMRRTRTGALRARAHTEGTSGQALPPPPLPKPPPLPLQLSPPSPAPASVNQDSERSDAPDAPDPGVGIPARLRKVGPPGVSWMSVVCRCVLCCSSRSFSSVMAMVRP